MKKITFLSCTLIILVGLLAFKYVQDEESQKGLATVEEAANTPVFLLSKPKAEYSVAFEVEVTKSEETSVREIATEMAQKAKAKGAFDAIWYDLNDSTKAKAIKFNDKPEELVSMVYEINGIPVYIMAEPKAPYRAAFEVGFTPPQETTIQGIVTNLVNQALERTKSANIPFDALIYHGHGVLEKRADAVSYVY